MADLKLPASAWKGSSSLAGGGGGGGGEGGGLQLISGSDGHQGLVQRLHPGQLQLLERRLELARLPGHSHVLCHPNNRLGEPIPNSYIH